MGSAAGLVIVGPLLSLIDKIDPADNVSGYIGTGLNILALLSSGNPTGLIFQGAILLVDGFIKQAERKKSNLKPGEDRGKKMGYVRVGDTWKPAVFNTRIKGTGLWDDSGAVTAQYGDHILFKLDASMGASDVLQPVVFNDGTDPIGHKIFSMSDKDYDNLEMMGAMGRMQRYSKDGKIIRPSGKAGLKYDPFRNYYFLSPDELTAFKNGKLSMEAYDAPISEGANPYEKQIDDWRRVTEMMATGGTADKALARQMTEWDVTTELHNALNHEGSIDEFKNMKGGIAPLMSGVWGWDNPFWGFDKTKTDDEYYDKLVSEKDFFRGAMPENDYIMNTMFVKQVQRLQKLQKLAATEANFDHLYGYDPWKDHHKDWLEKGRVLDLMKYDPTYGKMSEFRSDDLSTPWSSLYLDTAKSLDTASSYTDLAAQLDTIHGYDDRTATQKQYLVQKAITRYWIGQITSRGGTSDLLEKMYSKSVGEDGSFKRQLNAPAYDFDRVMGDGDIDDPFDNIYESAMGRDGSGTSGWVLPWQNAGESLLPDDIMLSGLDDWWTTEYERLSDEARENTTAWISEHGKFNPNVLIDGYIEPMTDRDILDDVSEGVDIGDEGDEGDEDVVEGLGTTDAGTKEDPDETFAEMLADLDIDLSDPVKKPPKVTPPDEPDKKMVPESTVTTAHPDPPKLFARPSPIVVASGTGVTLPTQLPAAYIHHFENPGADFGSTVALPSAIKVV